MRSTKGLVDFSIKKEHLDFALFFFSPFHYFFLSSCLDAHTHTSYTHQMSVSLIVALKGCTNIELEGHIIRIGNGANTNTVRGLAAEKLGLAVPLDEINLETSSGVILTEIEKVKLQQVVYISYKEQIKQVPGPRRLPMVGNLYDMLPDL